MKIAVAEGAPDGGRFIDYVEYLDRQGFVPPKGKGWVDYIRKTGNEGTHEIALMSEDDARGLIEFVAETLERHLRFPSPRTS